MLSLRAERSNLGPMEARRPRGGIEGAAAPGAEMRTRIAELADAGLEYLVLSPLD
jgi:hypothetical protein